VKFTDRKIAGVQLLEMLQLQDQFNSSLDTNWRQADWPFHRAIWTECAEMLEHYGWKWWKKQEPDAAQVGMELVDIWHFAMSQFIVNYGSEMNEAAAEELLKLLEVPVEDEGFIRNLEFFTSYSLINGYAHFPTIPQLMENIGMSFEALYTQYIGKNALNKFRQDNGYKTGTYRKNWSGAEDNMHLSLIISQADLTAGNLYEYVYASLETSYSSPFAKLA
jgi:dimeric dUTPase (all-alpha-NTP-PPase superfamily)